MPSKAWWRPTKGDELFFAWIVLIHVGAVAGLIGFAGAIGGVVFGQLVGYLLDHGYGWTFVFALAGSFHVIAFFVICTAIPSIQPVITDKKETLSPSAA